MHAPNCAPIILPKLVQRETPNKSSRVWPIHAPLVVIHETAGHYAGAVSWLRNPRADASAHFVLREDGKEATQLVPLHEKAWTEAAFNWRGISIEIADVSGRGFTTEFQLHVAARMTAWLCHAFKIPPRWSKDGGVAGICRHRDLGIAGGGHLSCGPAGADWTRFLGYVAHEIERGDFKRKWAVV